jgi:hypothetical protein
VPTRTRSLPVFALLVGLLSACTGGGEPDPSSSPSPSQGEGVVTDDVDVDYVPGEFQYRFNNVGATFSMADGTGTLTVKNASGAEIGAPGVYFVGADDLRYDATVAETEAIPDGAEVTLDVSLPPEVTPESVGLVVLLFGASNYGAMSPVPAA